MIRIAVLLTTAVIVTLLAIGDRTLGPAEALVPPIPCDAKIGVVENEGLHPFLWPFIQEMGYTPQPAQQDQSQEFSLGPSTASIVDKAAARRNEAQVSLTGRRDGER